MAALAVGRIVGFNATRKTFRIAGVTVTVRTAVTSAKGEILPKPLKNRFGAVKALSAAIPGILIGATLAKNGAAWLEENEIFIPDDDDDEDD